MPSLPAMEEKRDGGPAFPISYADGHRDGAGAHIYSSGMALRDYFAAQALAGILSHPESENVRRILGDVARHAYLFADAMLKAREAKP